MDAEGRATIGVAEKFRRIQLGLARRALEEPDHRFGKLWELVAWKLALILAIPRSGAVIFENQDSIIQELSNELRAGVYRPGQDPEGRDRIVAAALLQVLHPIYESKFAGGSHGSRPGRNCSTAAYQLFQAGDLAWVIRGSAAGCEHHGKLMSILERTIADSRFLSCLAAFRKVTSPSSALGRWFGNVYLNEFDQWFLSTYSGEAWKLIRYDGEFVIGTSEPREKAWETLAAATRWMREELYLETDARLVRPSRGFSFLGFHFGRRTGQPGLNVEPSSEAVKAFKARIRAMTRRDSVYVPEGVKFAALATILREWTEQYCWCDNHRVFSALARYIDERVFRWLRAKHRRRGVWIRYRKRCRDGRYRWAVGGQILPRIDVDLNSKKIPRIPQHAYLSW